MMKALRFKITSWIRALDFQGGFHGDPFHVERVLVLLLTGQLEHSGFTCCILEG